MGNVKLVGQPWPDSSAAWRIDLIHQNCVVRSLSGHIEEATNKCINGWNKKSTFLSLFLSVSLSNIFFLMVGSVGEKT